MRRDSKSNPEPRAASPETNHPEGKSHALDSFCRCPGQQLGKNSFRQWLAAELIRAAADRLHCRVLELADLLLYSEVLSDTQLE
jgi:hypothetical protein